MSDWQAGNISMLVSIMYVLTLVASLRACNSSLLHAIMLYGRLAIFPWWTQCGVKVVYFTWFSPEQLQGQRSCLGEYHCCRIAHFHWAEQSFHSRCFGLSCLQCWISVSHATKPCAQPCWRPSWNGADLYLAEGVFFDQSVTVEELFNRAPAGSLFWEQFLCHLCEMILYHLQHNFASVTDQIYRHMVVLALPWVPSFWQGYDQWLCPFFQPLLGLPNFATQVSTFTVSSPPRFCKFKQLH